MDIHVYIQQGPNLLNENLHEILMILSTNFAQESSQSPIGFLNDKLHLTMSNHKKKKYAQDIELQWTLYSQDIRIDFIQEYCYHKSIVSFVEYKCK